MDIKLYLNVEDDTKIPKTLAGLRGSLLLAYVSTASSYIRIQCEPGIPKGNFRLVVFVWVQQREL